MTHSTPLMINILIHHFTSSAPYSGCSLAHANSPVVLETTGRLLSEGMLAEDTSRNSGLTTTARANAFLYHILDLPFPEPKWLMPAALTSQNRSTAGSDRTTGEDQ